MSLAQALAQFAMVHAAVQDTDFLILLHAIGRKRRLRPIGYWDFAAPGEERVSF